MKGVIEFSHLQTPTNKSFPEDNFGKVGIDACCRKRLPIYLAYILNSKYLYTIHFICFVSILIGFSIETPVQLGTEKNYNY
jgi:hypothetical protein